MIEECFKLLFILFLIINSVLSITILNETSSIQTQAIFIPHKIHSALSIRSDANKLLNSFRSLNNEKSLKKSSQQLLKTNERNDKIDSTMKRITDDELAITKFPDLSDQSETKPNKQEATLTLPNTMIVSSTVKAESSEKKIVNDTIRPSTSGRTNFRIFEVGGFCEGKSDGLYDDDDCENFIICYAGRTFRTKCALGTMWNHWTKECDFPEKVDCDRRESTLKPLDLTLNSTATKRSTYSAFSRRTLHTRPTLLAEDMSVDVSSNIKTKANIVLISILIPIAIIALVVLIVSLWVWNRTFKQQRRQLESTRKINNSNNHSSHSSRLNDHSISDTIGRRIQKRCSCLCNPIIWSKKHNSFKPYMMHVCSKSGNCMKSLKSNSERVSRMSGYDDFRKANSNSIPLTPIENCQIASNSHATLSSHFEENNWDYNFATRGLYLTQPWVRGEYNQTFIADSYAGSLVLTLDPCIDNCDSPVASTNNQDAMITNGLYSDADGYYA